MIPGTAALLQVGFKTSLKNWRIPHFMECSKSGEVARGHARALQSDMLPPLTASKTYVLVVTAESNRTARRRKNGPIRHGQIASYLLKTGRIAAWDGVAFVDYQQALWLARGRGKEPYSDLVRIFHFPTPASTVLGVPKRDAHLPTDGHFDCSRAVMALPARIGDKPDA